MNTFKKRVDELGRIVIPKEIRNCIKINNFDELDLFIDNDSIVIKKSIGLELYKKKLDTFLELLRCLLDFKILIFNSNKLISNNYENSNSIINFKLDFDYLLSKNNTLNTISINGNNIDGIMYVDNIIIDSNLIGYILFLGKERFNNIELLKKIKNIIIDLIN